MTVANALAYYDTVTITTVKSYTVLAFSFPLEKKRLNDATTLSLTTLSIMTFSITTLSITTFSITHSTKRHSP
jgi:hypothetical protein